MSQYPEHIEPKPTRYRGIEFRSRLEARWAVFLDHHLLVDDWKYEPRSFQLPNGSTYTPDFWFSVAQSSYYIEAKPLLPTEDYVKYVGVITSLYRINMLVAVGSFWNEEPVLYEIAPGTIYGVAMSSWAYFRLDPKAMTLAKGFRFDLNLPSYVPPSKYGSKARLEQSIDRWRGLERSNPRRKRKPPKPRSR